MDRFTHPRPPVSLPCQPDESGTHCVLTPPIDGDIDVPPVQPRASGYLCANNGGLFTCGGQGQSFDPCYEDRHLQPEGVCLIVPANRQYPVDLPFHFEACPGLVISFMITALISVVCP